MIGVERANHARLGFPMWTRRATMLSVAGVSTFGGVVSPLGAWSVRGHAPSAKKKIGLFWPLSPLDG